MSKSINSVALLGNVGRDPETKTLPSGTVASTFSLATSERYKDKDGEWQDVSEWHNIVSYGKVAEVIRDYVSKGSKLYIQGKLTTRSWEKDGQKHYRTEVVVSEIVLLDGKGEKKQTQAPQETVSDDDIPW